MVPEIDKKDTHVSLDNLRKDVESARQEILGWSFMVPNPDNQGEAMALRQLAARSTQQTRQWIGRLLQQLNVATYPYPNSQDSSTQLIDKTAVPVTAGLGLSPDWTVVQKIKHVRSFFSDVKHDLEKILQGCIPGSAFNQCLLIVQEHSIQASMWLGELLALFVDVPQVKEEAPAGESELSSPEPNTEPATPTGSDSETGSESANEAPDPLYSDQGVIK